MRSTLEASLPRHAEVTSRPPEPRRIILGVLLVMLIGGMNQAIVAVALPRIAERLDGFDLLAWVMSAYLVAATISGPIYGKLFDRYGVRAVLAGVLALFGATSLACAMSTTMPMLVAFRALQGLAGGGLIAGAQAAIALSVAPRDRGRYQAWISVTFLLSSVLGPVLGGWLTERLSWPWVFGVNLPLVVAAGAIAWRALRPLPVPGRRTPIDAIGAMLLSGGLTAVMIAITRAGQGLPWFDLTNQGWLIASVVMLGGYAWREGRVPEPMLPPVLRRNRTIAVGLLIQCLAHGAITALIVMVPLHMQLVSGLSPAAAASSLIALSVGVPFGAFIGGRTISATGRYRMIQVAGGSLCCAAVLGLAFAVYAHAPQAVTLALLPLAGVGFGLQFVTGTIAIQNATPMEHIGSAVGAVNSIRSLGGAVAIALLSTILLELLRAGAPELAAIDSGADVLRALTHPEAGALRDRLQPVAERAFAAIFLLCGLAVACALALVRAMPERALRG